MDSSSALESRIAALLAQKPRVLIALDGMSASGKTTLAAALAGRFSSCAVVHMDDFTIPFEVSRLLRRAAFQCRHRPV